MENVLAFRPHPEPGDSGLSANERPISGPGRDLRERIREAIYDLAFDPELGEFNYTHVAARLNLPLITGEITASNEEQANKGLTHLIARNLNSAEVAGLIVKVREERVTATLSPEAWRRGATPRTLRFNVYRGNRPKEV